MGIRYPSKTSPPSLRGLNSRNTSVVFASTLKTIEGTAYARGGRWNGWSLRQIRIAGVAELGVSVSEQPYRIASVNLHTDEIDWLDEVRHQLRQRGLTKVTRSEVVRLAVANLRRQIQSAGDSELVNFFLQELVRSLQRTHDNQNLSEPRN